MCLMNGFHFSLSFVKGTRRCVFCWTIFFPPSLFLALHQSCTASASTLPKKKERKVEDEGKLLPTHTRSVFPQEAAAAVSISNFFFPLDGTSYFKPLPAQREIQHTLLSAQAQQCFFLAFGLHFLFPSPSSRDSFSLRPAFFVWENGGSSSARTKKLFP